MNAELSKYEELRAGSEDASPRELVARALQLFGRERMCLVSSFGADAAVLLHIVSTLDASIPVVFLDTGKHFPETLVYKAKLKEQLGLTNVVEVFPQREAVATYDPAGDLWSRNADQCCSIRKVVPLQRALAPFGCWINGRKRYQNESREGLPKVELVDGRVKLNPIAHFSAQDVANWFLAHGLPAHPLEANGYLSIGCAPCTLPVRPGESHRAGRWQGAGKSECGIHTSVLFPDRSSSF